MRYFLLGILVAFVLFWATTGIRRRLAPPRRPSTYNDVPGPQRDARKRSHADYSEARDVDYRDL